MEKNKTIKTFVNLAILILVSIMVISTISEQSFRNRGLMSAIQKEKNYIISTDSSKTSSVKILKHNRITWENVINFGWQPDFTLYYNDNDNNTVKPYQFTKYSYFPWIKLASSYLYALSVIFCGLLGSLIISLRRRKNIIDSITMGLISGFLPYLGINLFMYSLLSNDNSPGADFSPYTSASIAFIYGLVAEQTIQTVWKFSNYVKENIKVENQENKKELAIKDDDVKKDDKE